MNDEIHKSALRSGRIKSALFLMLVGLPLAGFLLGVMAVPVQLFDLPGASTGVGTKVFGAGFVFALFSFLGSAPVAMLAIAIGGIFLARGNVIALRSLLLALAITLAVCGLVLSILTGALVRLSNIPGVLAAFVSVAIPLLASAAICWRITRRWHSSAVAGST
ncbi:MAG: hypothetical protein FD175_1892 [Beijerinckiaceae bacterium]|nr:MAG: hypothetical protein FD175_1892 [Beijerinckiaceae bacterium]